MGVRFAGKKGSLGFDANKTLIKRLSILGNWLDQESKQLNVNVLNLR